MLSPLICTPCYTQRPCIIYVTSLVQLSPVPDLIMPSCCNLAEARTAGVVRFLQGTHTGWTHLFFIDDDMGFDGPTFRRMLTSGLDVVGAAAPFRSDDIHYQGGFTVDRDDIGKIDENGFAPITLIGAGFMCIKRNVLERMRNYYALPEFFALSKKDDVFVEEDHAFCQRWRQIGGTVHIDTQAELAHQGTKVYSRDFGAYLAGKENIPGTAPVLGAGSARTVDPGQAKGPKDDPG